ncbi:MAG TPA: YbdK family carboxylate-amine ligase [Solirubrobacteraceae bacterium]|nr:YbdK family carboxylate-amine ligase [Solirubrobacteraceae bacterium]
MSTETPNPPPTAAELRARFDAAVPYTIGIEDELMVLDPDTLELTPRAPEVLSRVGDDPRFKLELPSAQLEIVVEPAATVAEAARALLEARQDLAARVEGAIRFAAAGVHPTSPGTGELNQSARYDHVIREYGQVAARQLVCALQVHVSVPGADRALAVYNAARSYLPWLAALAANAPFYEGRDTGLASVRAKIGELLPRQGVPPAFESWDAYAATLAWGARTGAFPGASSWWYELRLHPRFGTLELRVPDGQTTVPDAAAIAAVAQALLAWLAERHDGAELDAPAETWRIEQNRWWACRDGVDGDLADLDTGAMRPTRERLRALLDTLEPVASRLGATDGLTRARELVECNGAIAQRRVAAHAGIPSVPGWLASKFLEP